VIAGCIARFTRSIDGSLRYRADEATAHRHCGQRDQVALCYG